MISKTLVFSRIEKTVSKIEDAVNAFLKEIEFKYAIQNESTAKGKFTLSIFGNESSTKNTVRAKAFKDQDIKVLDVAINEFIGKHGMKFVTQTFVGSSMYTIIFYDTKKKDDKDTNTTTPPTGDNNNGSN